MYPLLWSSWIANQEKGLKKQNQSYNTLTFYYQINTTLYIPNSLGVIINKIKKSILINNHSRTRFARPRVRVSHALDISDKNIYNKNRIFIGRIKILFLKNHNLNIPPLLLSYYCLISSAILTMYKTLYHNKEDFVDHSLPKILNKEVHFLRRETNGNLLPKHDILLSDVISSVLMPLIIK